MFEKHKLISNTDQITWVDQNHRRKESLIKMKEVFKKQMQFIIEKKYHFLRGKYNLKKVLHFKEGIMLSRKFYLFNRKYYS